MSLMFKLMVTSARTRDGRVSPILGFDTCRHKWNNKFIKFEKAYSRSKSRYSAMKKATNLLAGEQAQLSDFREILARGRNREPVKPARRKGQGKVTCHFSSLIRHLALEVPLRKIFPKSGRLQTYAYLESIYDSLHGSLYAVHGVTRK